MHELTAHDTGIVLFTLGSLLAGVAIGLSVRAAIEHWDRHRYAPKHRAPENESPEQKAERLALNRVSGRALGWYRFGDFTGVVIKDCRSNPSAPGISV